MLLKYLGKEGKHMKVSKLLNKSISIFFFLIILLVLFLNLQSFPILISIFIIGAVLFTIKKNTINEKHFIVLIILLTLITHFLCVFGIKNSQLSDFKTLFDISQDLLDGSLNENSQNYINTWPYQTPFILYQTLLLKICNTDTFLKIFNTIINIFISLLMYSISKQISNKKSAQIVTTLYILFANKILYGNILTNQYPYMLFLLLGIYLFFSENIKNEKIRVLLLGICTSIANLFRPEGIVILISFICYELYICIKEKKYINIIINITIFVSIYLSVCNGTMYILKKVIIKEPQDIGILYKVVLGLDFESNGQWDLSEFNTLFSFDNKQDLIKYEKDKILHSICDSRIIKLFIIKINTFWNDFDTAWTLNYLYTSGVYLGPIHLTYATLYTLIYNYDLIIWLFILILAFMGIKGYNSYSIFLELIIIINFMVYLLIEVQGRYSVFCRLLLFILSSKGFSIIYKKLNTYTCSQKNINGSEKND